MVFLLRSRMMSCLLFMFGKLSIEDEKQMSGEENINLSGQDPSGQNPNGQNPANESSYFGSVEHYNVHGDPSLYGDDYFKNFPPGYRFKPYDEELVVHYLSRKIVNQTLPPNRIKEVQLYKCNPEDLAEKHISNGEKEWYFFTPRDRKYKNGDRPNRAAGDGYWKATGADKPVKYDGVVVGSRKALVFYKGKPPKGDKTQWIMHEFRVENQPKKKRGVGEEMRLDDWVLCRLYKKVDKSRSKDNAVPNQEPENNIPPPSQDMSVEDSKMPPQENFMPEGLESFDHLYSYYNPANQMGLHQFDNALYLNGPQGSFPGVPQSFYPQLGQNSMVQNMIPGYQNSSLLIGEQLTPTESYIKHEHFNDYHSDELLNIPSEVNCFDQIVSNFSGAYGSIYPTSFNDDNGACNTGITSAHNDHKKRKKQKKHQ